LELGDVMDAYAKKRNVRHREGAIGIFTNGFIDRKEMFAHIMKLLIGQYQFSKKN
jgi:non-canonical (house-cleaning) NTP pyrophosphatase